MISKLYRKNLNI